MFLNFPITTLKKIVKKKNNYALEIDKTDNDRKRQ